MKTTIRDSILTLPIFITSFAVIYALPNKYQIFTLSFLNSLLLVVGITYLAIITFRFVKIIKFGLTFGSRTLTDQEHKLIDDKFDNLFQSFKKLFFIGFLSFLSFSTTYFIAILPHLSKL